MNFLESKEEEASAEEELEPFLEKSQVSKR
jgi:hypothetical protein